jgi:hypothetical protein
MQNERCHMHHVNRALLLCGEVSGKDGFAARCILQNGTGDTCGE